MTTHTQVPANRTASVLVAAIGTFALVAYAGLALVQVLVLNPLAAVPGKSLDQIIIDVEAAGESFGIWLVVACLVPGPMIAVALLIRARVANSVMAVASWYLGLLALGAVAYFWASIGPGMALADTYLISGGDHSPLGALLYGVSGAALVALLVLGAWRLLRSAPRT